MNKSNINPVNTSNILSESNENSITFFATTSNVPYYDKKQLVNDFNGLIFEL